MTVTRRDLLTALLATGMGLSASSALAASADNADSESSTEDDDMGLYGSYARRTAAFAREYADAFETYEVDGKDVFVHMPAGAPVDASDVNDAGLPLVLFMCGTTGNPRGDAAWSGWVEESDAQGFVLVTPDYNNYAMYSETGFLSDVIDWALSELPVDAARVYSVGFSNGGAISVAMTSEYPEKIAAISAAGWMVSLRNEEGPTMPFQVIQGRGEYTERTASGSVQVMSDEREAIRGLMLRDGLIDASEQTNYDETPYWGYAPSSTSSEQAGDFTWDFSNYYREGYEHPFAQLVIASDDTHRPRTPEAHIAWAFLHHFARESDGSTVEL